MVLRQPIVAMLGHVDHGKTLILDSIRGSAIQKKEAGGISQQAGASVVPTSVIEKLCGYILEEFKFKLKIPGVLFLDTPGHFAFSSMRERGGSIADLGVLVIDVKSGFQPQTFESLRILENFKTPFVVAANKIDLIEGWKAQNTLSFLQSIKQQMERTKAELDKQIYDLIATLSEQGYESERLDRVRDFSKEVTIIPTSAKTREGIAELLAIISGLAQRYLEKELRLEVKGPAKGTVLEVREEKGLGPTINVIIYDGTLRVGDRIVIGGVEEPIVTKVKALLQPKPLEEIRESVRKFKYVDQATAAAGVKIAASGLEKVVAGVPFMVAEDVEKVKKEIQTQVRKVSFETDQTGIILKADSLGALEALISICREKFPIRRASIGPVAHRDLVEAEIIQRENPLLGVIFAFRVKLQEDVVQELKAKKLKVFQSDIIYKLIEDYEEWLEREKEKMKKEKLEGLIWPGKLRLLGPDYVFRTRKPAIVGVEVLVGKIKPGYGLMRKDGKVIGKIKQIQSEGESLEKAGKGDKVAISISDVTIGRQISDKEELYNFIPKEDLEKWKEEGEELSKEEIEILNEISTLQ